MSDTLFYRHSTTLKPRETLTLKNTPVRSRRWFLDSLGWHLRLKKLRWLAFALKPWIPSLGATFLFGTKPSVSRKTQPLFILEGSRTLVAYFERWCLKPPPRSNSTSKSPYSSRNFPMLSIGSHGSFDLQSWTWFFLPWAQLTQLFVHRHLEPQMQLKHLTHTFTMLLDRTTIFLKGSQRPTSMWRIWSASTTLSWASSSYQVYQAQRNYWTRVAGHFTPSGPRDHIKPKRATFFENNGQGPDTTSALCALEPAKAGIDKFLWLPFFLLG